MTELMVSKSDVGAARPQQILRAIAYSCCKTQEILKILKIFWLTEKRDLCRGHGVEWWIFWRWPVSRIKRQEHPVCVSQRIPGVSCA